MTRRIAISILLTVWLVLILAGGLAYFVTRSLLVQDLDATLMARALSLPEIDRPASLAGPATTTPSDVRDRFLIRNADGQMLRPENIAHPQNTATTDEQPHILSATFSTLAGGERIRTITVHAFARRASTQAPLVPVTVVYSGPADRLDHMLTRLLLALGIFGLVAGLGTAGVAVAVAKNALKPLVTTADLIAAITEKNLDSRLAIDRLPRELAPVGVRLNDLLARLEIAFAQRKQFLADASHELRTPVAALVTNLEVTLTRPRLAEDYLHTLQSCLADARHLHQLVAALMDQVRSEQFAADPAAAGPVNLSAVLQHCARIAAALASPRQIRLDLALQPNVVALTDELRVRSIVTNLLSNAIEYTPSGGLVTLTLQILPEPPLSDVPTHKPLPFPHPPLPPGVDASWKLLRITVEDTGPGIPAEHLPHLFQPFYRADKARSNPDSHLGLGLFLVQAHAAALGGDCRVETAGTRATRGAKFVVQLPVAVLAESPSPDPVSPRHVAADATLQATHG